ncbi:unnamed protein product [Thelazia callipaeda]|uniref:Pinin/SDK/MemA protein domain-containing protein n=1 Tax=Thelazia callipaeda TaxID=103827 RepID=A0A0N5CSB5_THECL|nr:unnamed protein product [Thelazia callipaeda]
MPFHFQTEERIHTHKCLQEVSMPKIHRRSYSTGNLRDYQGPGIRLNHAAVLRREANRSRDQKLEAERNFSRKFWASMKERSELARIKLRQKKDQQQRANQYQLELQQINQRVRSRALILEQQEMLAKCQRFERKYQKVMTAVKRDMPKHRNRNIRGDELKQVKTEYHNAEFFTINGEEIRQTEEREESIVSNDNMVINDNNSSSSHNYDDGSDSNEDESEEETGNVYDYCIEDSEYLSQNDQVN